MFRSSQEEYEEVAHPWWVTYYQRASLQEKVILWLVAATVLAFVISVVGVCVALAAPQSVIAGVLVMEVFPISVGMSFLTAAASLAGGLMLYVLKIGRESDRVSDGLSASIQQNHIIYAEQLKYDAEMPQRNAELVTKIREAFKEMYKEFEPEYKELLAKLGEIAKGYDRLDEAYDRIDAAYNRIEGSYDRMDAAYDRMDAAYDRMDATNKRINATYDRINATYDVVLPQMRENIATLNEATRQIVEGNRVMQEEIQALRQVSQAQQQQLQESKAKCEALIRLAAWQIYANFRNQAGRAWPVNKVDAVLANALPPQTLQELQCPISREVMQDPVRAPDGKCYDRWALQVFYDNGHRVCPCDPSKVLVDPKTLGTDGAMKEVIDGFYRAHAPQAAPQQQQQVVRVSSLQAGMFPDRNPNNGQGQGNNASAVVERALVRRPDVP